MKRLAVVRQHPNKPVDVLAVFALDGQEVRATWRDVNYQLELEAEGTPVDPETGKAWRPQDGPEFFEALPRAYQRATLINVYDPDNRSPNA